MARHQRGQTILVVDDQDVIREFLVDLLDVEGYAVKTAPDGATALAQLDELRPNLVITDVSMPGMDGWEMAQAMRAQPYGSTLPIILMSAATQLPFSRAALDPAMAFLAKPFSIDDLIRIIECLIQV